MNERSTEGPDWLDAAQQPPAETQRRATALRSLLVDDDGLPIESLGNWERRRLELIGQWKEFLGPITPTRDSSPGYEVLEETELEDVIRSRIRYPVEPNCWVEAYLIKPIDHREPLPGVMVFHSTVPETIRQPAGIEGEPRKAFGLKLARQGYVTLSPRCFLWESGHRHFFSFHARRQVRRMRHRHADATGMSKMLHDAQVGLDVLAQLPEVDSRRLGAVGHSLGAKQTLYLAALDDRIRVAVSSEGGIGMSFSNWTAPWYLGKRSSPSHLSREHHELLGLVAPRAFLLIGGDSADGDHSWPFVQEALRVYQLYDGRPRIGLYNHRQGHTVPGQAENRIDDWFHSYL